MELEREDHQQPMGGGGEHGSDKACSRKGP